MKARIGLVVAAFFLGEACAFAQHGFHGKSWIDEDFASYSIAKVSVTVRGGASSLRPELNAYDVADAVKKALRRKGYEVVEEGAKAEADANLVLAFYSSQYRGQMKSVEIEGQISLLKGSKKTVYKVSGEVRRAGLNLSENEISDALDPLPARPEAGKKKGARER
jgi:hypothetical protein